MRIAFFGKSKRHTRTTSYTSVPVHGQAKPGSSVIIEGTANGNIAAEVNTDGRFCADIKLMSNRLNVLSVYTDNNHGNDAESDVCNADSSDKSVERVAQPGDVAARYERRVELGARSSRNGAARSGRTARRLARGIDDRQYSVEP